MLHLRQIIVCVNTKTLQEKIMNQKSHADLVPYLITHKNDWVIYTWICTWDKSVVSECWVKSVTCINILLGNIDWLKDHVIVVSIKVDEYKT